MARAEMVVLRRLVVDVRDDAVELGAESVIDKCRCRLPVKDGGAWLYNLIPGVAEQIQQALQELAIFDDLDCLQLINSRPQLLDIGELRSLVFESELVADQLAVLFVLDVVTLVKLLINNFLLLLQVLVEVLGFVFVIRLV